MLPGYPSPKQVGDRAVKNLFDGPVVVQEKVDGSQISFGVSNGVLYVKSRSALLNVLAPDKMFSKAVEKLTSIQHLLPNGAVFRGEYLSRPKHNVLAYDRVPEGNIALFDIYHDGYHNMGVVRDWALHLGLDVVPVIYVGALSSPEALRGFLDRVSFLGGAKIEGVVVKNYALATNPEATFAAKFVSEEFKEVHAGKAEGAERTPKVADEPIESRLIRAYKTPARWSKAVQHLREAGRLTDSPKDIGLLIKEVQSDIETECGGDIRDALYAHFEKTLKNGFIDGLAVWYKDQLLKQSFGSDTNGSDLTPANP